MTGYRIETADYMKKAFTLIEILIVAAILGIMAAIVLPLFGDQVQLAKEAAAKDDLRVIRGAIERYSADHRDVPPGYVNGSFGSNGSLIIQLLYCTDINGNTNYSITSTSQYTYGPYIKNMPENPFNGKITITSYPDNMDLPSEATGDTFAWLYKPSTKDLRLNSPGSDAKGKAYYGY